MQIGRIKGTTRVLGKAQGYMGLPVRDEVVGCGAKGCDCQVPAMVTAWLPTPKELAALNAGAAVHVQILGNVHPPMMVTAGEAPDETPPERGPTVPK
jgi:hypothetical protein